MILSFDKITKKYYIKMLKIKYNFFIFSFRRFEKVNFWVKYYNLF